MPPLAPASSRDSLVAQIAAVQAGQSSRIRIEEGVIQDCDLELLADLTNLESLVLQGATDISDSGLAHLKRLTNLQTLNLNRTSVTDDGLAPLAGLTQLQLLRLGSSQVRGPGLKYLSGLSSLKHLILQRAPLTDEGLTHLHLLSRLEALYVEETEISPEGLEELRKALPSLNHIHPHN